MEHQGNTFSTHGSRIGVQAGIFRHDGPMNFNFVGSNHSGGREENPECLATLFFNNYDARKQDISEACSKTCDWLLETPEFRQWRNRSNFKEYNGVFWLKGKPGSGKSTMMRHISQQLEKSPGAIYLEHFFNARGSGLEKTFLGLLRSLIFQLLSKDLEFYNAFIPMYHRKEMNPGQWEWRQNELSNFLRSEIKRSNSNLIILVDALDECIMEEIASVVAFLENLSLDAVEVGANLQICLSSRPYPNVSMKKNLEFTLDDNLEHRKDIKKYIRAKLKAKDPDIKWEILQKADGVFLWVVLVVGILNKAIDRGHPEEMQRTLDHTPSDLDSFFERIIFNHPEKNPETLLMFQLILFSNTELSPDELVFAVIAETHKGYLMSRSEAGMSNGLIEARIVDSSKGLIEVSGRKRVQFIHKTVPDFFLRAGRLEKLYPTLKPDVTAASHDRLRACCLDYILKFPIDCQSNKTLSAKELEKEYPFLEYSVIHLLTHAEKALQGHQIGVENVRWPQSSDPWFQAWKRVISAISKEEILNNDMTPGLVYILILLDLPGLFRTILRHSDIDVNAQGGKFNNALQLALARKDDITATMLLEHGASVHHEGGQFGTVLQIASAQGDHAFVSTILENGANLNASSGVYGTALQAAAARGKLEIVKALLQRGADVNVYGGIYGSALQGAAHNGNLEIVNLLIEKGALINFQGGVYGSTLQAAMRNQKFEIFQRLLQVGANVNSYGGICGSWLDVDSILDIPALIHYPLGPSNFELEGTSLSLENAPPLVWAARNSEYHQVMLLLDNGADVNAASRPWDPQFPVICTVTSYPERRSVNFESGMTALIWAARNGKKDILELLLKHGANLEAQSSSGETAPLAASHAGHDGIVRILIEHGANPSVKDVCGNNVLYRAASNGHDNVMRIFLNDETFHDIDNWSDLRVIDFTSIVTMTVNSGFFLATSNTQEKGFIGTLEMNGGFLGLETIGRADNQIEHLIMNGGFLYWCQTMRGTDIYIENFQINGGICYFDITVHEFSYDRISIGKIEINGGSLHFMGFDKIDINHLQLHNGQVLMAGGASLTSVEIRGGILNYTGEDIHIEQIKMRKPLRSQFPSVDLQNVNSHAEIYVKHSDGRIEQHGIAQPSDQTVQMSDVFSPLHVAALNGHVEAVRLLLESGAKVDKARGKITPLYVAKRHGHHDIQKLLREKGQKEEEEEEENDQEDIEKTGDETMGDEETDGEEEKMRWLKRRRV